MSRRRHGWKLRTGGLVARLRAGGHIWAVVACAVLATAILVGLHTQRPPAVRNPAGDRNVPGRERADGTPVTRAHGGGLGAEDLIQKVLAITEGLETHRVCLKTSTYKTRADSENGKQAGSTIVQHLEYDPAAKRYRLAPLPNGGKPREVLFSVDISSVLDDTRRYPRRRILREETLAGKKCRVLEIRPKTGELKTILWVDGSGLVPVKARVVNGAETLAETFFEYQGLKGFRVPKRVTTRFPRTGTVVTQQYDRYAIKD